MTKKPSTRSNPTDESRCRRHSPGDPPLPKSVAASDADATEADNTEADADVCPNEGASSSEVERLRLDLEEVTDRALRAQAELENYRRRIDRQRQEEHRYANMRLLRDLLPVLDNMRRAIRAAEKTEDVAGLLEGFQMVAKQLEDVLQRHHCTEIKALGAPFDPNLHEAISQQLSDDYPAGTVMLVTQPGFQLHDRVVRPSQVIVAGTPPQPPTGQDSDTPPAGDTS